MRHEFNQSAAANGLPAFRTGVRVIQPLLLRSGRRCQAVAELGSFDQNARPMKKPLPNRIVTLEGDFWRIHPDEGELAAAEQQELRDYFDEIRLPYRIEHGRPCVPGSISWETIYERLLHFYDGRAEVCPF